MSKKKRTEAQIQAQAKADRLAAQRRAKEQALADQQLLRGAARQARRQMPRNRRLIEADETFRSQKPSAYKMR